MALAPARKKYLFAQVLIRDEFLQSGLELQLHWEVIRANSHDAVPAMSCNKRASQTSLSPTGLCCLGAGTRLVGNDLESAPRSTRSRTADDPGMSHRRAPSFGCFWEDANCTHASQS